MDYDNIYLSLKRKDDEAARRFAKDAVHWLKAIEQGHLITPTNSGGVAKERRIVMSRCYGNPVPRRNSRDNSTDMSSFPFVRHHFLRAGFEIIDCPPLTAQLKNSSDIRMVMDMRDFLTHETRFDEFIILSGDADFTPVLQRLRAHARSTIIFANENTATPYTAICDGEIREANLARLLIEGRDAAADAPAKAAAATAVPATAAEVVPSAPAGEDLDPIVADILAVITATVDVADRPVAIEAAEERVVRVLGSERTAGTGWAQSGSFAGFVERHLPDNLRVSAHAPFVIYNPERLPKQAAPAVQAPPVEPGPMPTIAGAEARRHTPQVKQRAPEAVPVPPPAPAPAPAAQAPSARRGNPVQQSATNLQQAVARIHEACQAPPLAPPEYKMLFELLSQELREFTYNGDATVTNVITRAKRIGFEPRKDDIRFVIDVVREADPYFEQGVTPPVFAGRFRNFVIARCRGQGMQLSVEEIDLIDAWFTGGIAGAVPRQAAPDAPRPREDDRWQPRDRNEAIEDDRSPRYARAGARR